MDSKEKKQDCGWLVRRKSGLLMDCKEENRISVYKIRLRRALGVIERNQAIRRQRRET